ncbi:RodZ domain-containing protein [Marinomonas epiphytica]
MTTDTYNEASEREATVASFDIGETLSTQRESLGLDQRQLASELKISIEQVRALEANEFNYFRSPTFVRGFLKSYCRVVQLDASVLIAAFNSLQSDAKPTIQPVDKVNKQSQLGDPFIVLISIVIIAVLVFLAFWWPSFSSDEDSLEEPLDAATETQAEEAQEDLSVLAGVPAPVQAEEPLAIDASQSIPSESQSDQIDVVTGLSAEQVALLKEAGVEEEVIASATKIPEPEVESPVTPVVPAYDHEIEMQFVADCWTEVRDNNGKILYSGVKSAGSSLTLNGEGPYRVVLGFARGVSSLIYKGEEFDFSSYVSKDLARFELK